MEFEFDKEIDALLRRARSGEAAFSGITSAIAGELKSAHLDADDISAFAENALPEKTKILYTAHLADCSRCRKILSDIISLNSEAESPAASSAVTAPENFAAAPAVPWYRKLFVFPQLTYAMGGLVLIFSGFLVYFVLQNSGRNAENSSISQMKERPQGMKGASSDGETTTVETSRSAANSASPQPNAMSMNTAVSNSATNTATGPTSMANSPANSNASISRKELTQREKEPEATPVPGPPAPPPPPPTTVSENQAATGGARPSAPALQNQPASVPADTKTTDEESTRAENKKDKDSTDDVALADRRSVKSAAKPSAKVTAEGENKQVAGKTFTRRNGVWYDPDYKGQSTTNISRGSEEYKKLDSGLRSIATGFSGTVVIIYKGRAYRIQ